jgi:hypothetical protein
MAGMVPRTGNPGRPMGCERFPRPIAPGDLDAASELTSLVSVQPKPNADASISPAEGRLGACGPSSAPFLAESRWPSLFLGNHRDAARVLEMREGETVSVATKSGKMRTANIANDCSKKTAVGGEIGTPIRKSPIRQCPSFTRFLFQAGMTTRRSLVPLGTHWQLRRDSRVSSRAESR